MYNEEKVLNLFNNNVFTMPQYSFGVELSDAFVAIARVTSRNNGYRDLRNNVDFFIDPIEYRKFADMVLKAVPEFQRGNDKWNDNMQSNFVRNILMGMKITPITLYSIDGSKNNCKILDGLQRLTAIYTFFFEDKLTFEIGNETLTSQELRSLVSDKKIFSCFSTLIQVEILHFNNELQAVEHYIQINENISHSTEDIERAKLYRKKLIEQIK